jgi:hypothetical protein
MVMIEATLMSASGHDHPLKSLVVLAGIIFKTAVRDADTLPVSIEARFQPHALTFMVRDNHIFAPAERIKDRFYVFFGLTHDLRFGSKVL